MSNATKQLRIGSRVRGMFRQRVGECEFTGVVAAGDSYGVSVDFDEPVLFDESCDQAHNVRNGAFFQYYDLTVIG